MLQNNTKPIYPLQYVTEETGVKADTLRAWERRYDLPKPARSAGGHRLYSERDLKIIRWLLQRQQEGMRISQAVRLWKSTISAGDDPLLDDKSDLFSLSPNKLTLQTLKNDWISACLEFDEANAEKIVHEAFSLFLPESALLEIFMPAICEIGALWYQGEATVQQEHFASALLVRRLNALILSTPVPIRPEKIVVACPPEEEHTLYLLVITFFLRRKGFNVVYLGANVPIEQLKETVQKIRPQLLILTAQQLSTAATLSQTVNALHSTVPIAYGGSIFNTTPSIKRQINAYFLGNHIEKVFPTIEKILATREHYPVHSLDNPLKELYEDFMLYRPAAHIYLTTQFASSGFPLMPMINANNFLSNNVAAALYFGDLDTLSPELLWAENLLKNRQLDHIPLAGYLENYANAFLATIGEKATPLAFWFDQKIDEIQERNR